ncbi:MAG: chromosome segregation protein SMC [Methylococcales bacterium]|nr:chromosome segregation protein SMC [Methylococcales bacterium]
MKLEKIKLSGFKSFVDTTVIPITSNLTAIVGPNGCGKSNIIDAVRWVMGESSAKHLRGGNMADVIFNGSSGRKPVSTASVELVFNNSKGKLGGEYAQYDSIAIKRQVSRDGLSVYWLNGSRCRRRDITDLFLGTGLGSRSYAIIEQGTISRMVEAKPDELRVHIEEAAGISKYKERRSETETRMRNTRDNLERLDDVREEVDKQIKHLQKQAVKAEKYTELKQQERQFKTELLAMRWHSYQQAAAALDRKLQAVAIEHNRLFVESRSIDSQLESQRTEHQHQQQQFNQVQGDYYGAVAEVGRFEQTIKHEQRTHEDTLLEIGRSQQQADHALSELEADNQALEDIKQQLDEAEQSWLAVQERQETVVQCQQDTQQQRQAWQAQWNSYQARTARYKEQAEVQRVKILQLDNQQQQLHIRLDRLLLESEQLVAGDLSDDIESLEASIELIETQREDLQVELEQLHSQSVEHRQQIKHLHDALHSHRSQQQQLTGKITSLELLQQHAMGKENKTLSAWLNQCGVAIEQGRLAEYLDVDAGWETAVETVLGSYLEAVCVAHIDSFLPHLPNLTDESLTLFGTQVSNDCQSSKGLAVVTPALLTKINAPWDLTALLSGIYCATDSDTAQQLAKNLHAHESVITPEGLWLGAGWLKIQRSKDHKTGVLQREKELRLLKHQLEQVHTEIADVEDCLAATAAHLKTAEVQRESVARRDSNLGMELSLKNAELSAQSARLEQQQHRLAQIRQEQQGIDSELVKTVEMLSEAHQLQAQAEAIMAEQETTRLQLETANQVLHTAQHHNEHAVNEARQQGFSIKATIEALRSSESLTSKPIERLRLQHQQAVARIAQLDNKQQQTHSTLAEEKALLADKTLEKNQLEQRLKTERQIQNELETTITELAKQHTRVQRALEVEKEALDKLRFESQESKVRGQTVNEQLKEIDADAEQVLKNLSEQATESAWKYKVDELTIQIECLGTINLTAIEEYKAQSERSAFLNAQHADLIEALQTLEMAISKIDKESRLRFKETFDKINSGLQEKFPKLFGGGHAYLELTEQDLLESGVTIIARPPGKKNSTIHLLSGGEKALTAVALVFSIFELNPAPFCLLDEVDAPLDDANVRRFSKMVEEMSATVQFLYISHNKVTMEISKQLAGVTMKEPGVSRMVAVDIEEAISLAVI